jgi:chromate reductase, NAD(P)H dehydrogenase (quinone)
MYTIISGTNRAGSNTLKVSKQIQEIFEAKGITTNLLSLQGLNTLDRNEALLEIETTILFPTTKYVVVTPEYNGGIPGVFKALLDNSAIDKAWWHKKAMLVGVSTGRAGNGRGLDFLTNIFNYLKMQVLPNKIPLSSIHLLLKEDERIADEGTLKALTAQVEEFIAF